MISVGGLIWGTFICPQINSKIELLIGSDVPKALESLNVIRSVGDVPYALKTMLGWTVNRPLGGKSDNTRVSAGCQSWNLTFLSDKQEPSKEDQQFLDLVSKSAKLVKDHYYIGLLLKESKICMPDNRCLAEQRMLNLQRRFKIHLDYTTLCLTLNPKVMQRGYPDGVLKRNDDRKCYVPDHGALHLQKKKLWVVFDCGATFRGQTWAAHWWESWLDSVKNLSSSLQTLKQCSTRWKYRMKTVTCYGSSGGLMEMTVRTWWNTKWQWIDSEQLHLHVVQTLPLGNVLWTIKNLPLKL